MKQTNSCERDQEVIRSHDFNKAASYIQEHRGRNPNGRCHIETALRSPNHWFASLYNERHRAPGEHCPDANIPSDERVKDFKTFLSTFKFERVFDTLGRLLNEYDVSLTSQFRLMDKNGGYSLVGPAPDNSIIAGCDLLFLRVEDSDNWSEIFGIYPGIRYSSGKSRLDFCPHAADTLKILEDYVMTKAEKETILSRDNTIKEWFDLYGYGDLENTKESSISSYNEAGTIYAVINTPKMATGTLQRTFSMSLKCKSKDQNQIKGVVLHNSCERDQEVIRSHDFNKAAAYIQQHRGSNPNGRCHIVTALRSPNQWFASMFNERTKADGHCPDVNIPLDER